MRQQAMQLYFPLPMYLELKVIAKKKSKPLTSWVREVMGKEVEKDRKTRKKLTDLPIYSWDVGDPYLSEHLDDVIYGDN